ncbi:hypothetical protein Fcan01_27623 [Folsomia candida]|uniref:Uncharacterized protein n=1 Tax=Folsomia candida TaxID=158441 RepID=A0A226CXX2_FOLCA|nr:hypothetical protein Fcan01_27623 [Folsomia candida]
MSQTRIPSKSTTTTGDREVENLIKQIIATHLQQMKISLEIEDLLDDGPISRATIIHDFAERLNYTFTKQKLLYNFIIYNQGCSLLCTMGPPYVTPTYDAPEPSYRPPNIEILHSAPTLRPRGAVRDRIHGFSVGESQCGIWVFQQGVFTGRYEKNTFVRGGYNRGCITGRNGERIYFGVPNDEGAK